MSATPWIKNTIARTISHVPFALQRRMDRSPVFLPFYHMVSDEPVPHLDHWLPNYPSGMQFEHHMEVFLRHFRPIDLRTLTNFLDTGSPLPERAFHLTFDDGYREMHDIVMPILLRKGIPATFFLNTATLDNRQLMYRNRMAVLLEHWKARSDETTAIQARIERLSYRDADMLDKLCAEAGVDAGDYLQTRRPYLTDAQVRAMLRHDFTIGSHSIDHAPYNLLSLADQLHQTLDCQDELIRRFELDYTAFAFPGGDGGVSREFFRAIEDKIAISFGTSHGFVEDEPRHLQRMGFEYSNNPVETVLADRLVTSMVRRLLGRDKRTRFANEYARTGIG